MALGLLLLSLQSAPPTNTHTLLLDAADLTDGSPPNIFARFVLGFLFVHLRMFFCFRLPTSSSSSSSFDGPSRVMLSSARRGAPASTSILLLVTREQDSLNRTWGGAFHPNLCYLATTAAVWQCTSFGDSLRENELSILAQLHNLHIVPLKATFTHFRCSRI